MRLLLKALGLGLASQAAPCFGSTSKWEMSCIIREETIPLCPGGALSANHTCFWRHIPFRHQAQVPSTLSAEVEPIVYNSPPQASRFGPVLYSNDSGFSVGLSLPDALIVPVVILNSDGRLVVPHPTDVADWDSLDPASRFTRGSMPTPQGPQVKKTPKTT